MKVSNRILEKRRPLLFVAGLLIALSATLVSFEWRTPYDELPNQVRPTTDFIDMDYVYEPLPVVYSQPERPTPPEPTITDRFNIEEDAKAPEAMDELTFADMNDFDLAETGPESDVDDDGIFTTSSLPATLNAEYCGGNEALSDFLTKHLKYPEIPLSMGVSGVVYVEFVVTKIGVLRDAKVIRPVDPWLDAEALRVAKLLDCFTPGMQAGRAVDVYFNLPVRFRLK